MICGTTTLVIDLSEYQHYLLRAVIASSTSAMRKADTHGVFLLPVTNDVAPGEQ